MSNNDELEEKIIYKKECLNCGYIVKEISKKQEIELQDVISKCPKCGNYLIVIEIVKYTKATNSVGDNYLSKQYFDEAYLEKIGFYEGYKEALNTDLKYGKRCFYKDFILKYNGEEIEITKYTGNEKIINIPDEINGFTVTTIGSGIFNWSSIKEVNLPNSLIKIDSSAFNKCHGLTKIYFPNTIKIIDDYAFFDCRNIKNLYIPDSVEKIGEHAFDLIEFEEVSIPNILTNISKYAFLEFVNIVRRK